ncbi:hypothetical protein PW252_11245 (plasmid) [Streptococcus sp. 29887]|uniref:Uncharacterized protein n=1 Tax=Streptococcus iners TaxID=3028084 RepID=A0AA96VVV9_9STRE|nr:hypothetical protein [Streptococcus sp. 29887]WNY52214.1 hypothetical protein PW252_11245 [Streptococcus sp. 29887]
MVNRLDSLIRNKKLTGAEVGRLVLSNVIHIYARALAGEKDPKPLFSQASLDNMVSEIEGSHSISIFNRYIALGQWLEKEGVRATGYYYSFQSAIRGYMLPIKASYTAEQYLADVNARPLVMTQEEYDKEVSDALTDFLKSHGDLTLGELIDSALERLYFEYKEHPKKQTTFKKELDKLAKIHASEEIIKHFNQLLGEEEYSEGVTLADLIEDGLEEGFFFPYAFDLWVTDNLEDKEIKDRDKKFLKKHYGDIIQVALSKIGEEIPKISDFKDFSETVISAEKAYKIDLVGFKETAKGASMVDHDITRRGVLIKSEKHKPIFGNFFEVGLMDLVAENDNLENLIADKEKQAILNYQRKQIKDAYIRLLAFNTVVDVLANNLNIKDFATLKEQERGTIELINAVNGTLEIFKEFLQNQSIVTWTDNLEAKLELFNGCLKPIDLDKLKIPEDRITALNSILDNDLEAFDNKKHPNLDIIEELIEGVGNE